MKIKSRIKHWFWKALPTLALLTVWLGGMWYATVAGAMELYDEWCHQAWSFRGTFGLSESAQIHQNWRVHWDRSNMAYLELPLLNSDIYVYDNPQWDSDLKPHMELAYYYLDDDGNAMNPEGRYICIRYKQPKVDYSYSDWCYMEMDTAPEEWTTWLEEALSGDEWPSVALHGYFEGERFILLKAEWTLDDTFNMNYRQKDWNLIFDRTEGVARPLTTLWSKVDILFGNECVIPVDTTTGPISVCGYDFDSFQALAEHSYSSMVVGGGDDAFWDAYCLRNTDVSFAALRETVFISPTWNLSELGAQGPEDVNYSSCIQILRCHPLRSAMLQLLPVYLVSLTAVLGTSFLIGWLKRRCYTQSLRNTLRRGEGYETEETVIPHGWTELTKLESRYIEATETVRRQTPELTRLETALSYAGDAEENRRKLVSDMTHELKTPLAVIHSYAEGLSEGIAPEKREKYLGIIMEEAEKMDAMVLSMLDLSRLEAGKVKLSREPVCLMDLAKATLEKLEPLYKEKNLTVHYFGKSFATLADEGRMEQVVTNLVSNAIKYCKPDGNISVTARREKAGTYFAIENDCDNLSEKALSQLFDSFFREDAARTTKGTGLGLPIVKAIVELHGGTCTAVNTYSGVEFRIKLPD